MAELKSAPKAIEARKRNSSNGRQPKSIPCSLFHYARYGARSIRIGLRIQQSPIPIVIVTYSPQHA